MLRLHWYLFFFLVVTTINWQFTNCFTCPQLPFRSFVSVTRSVATTTAITGISKQTSNKRHSSACIRRNAAKENIENHDNHDSKSQISGEIRKLLWQCVSERSVSAAQVIQTLEELEQQQEEQIGMISRDLVEGSFELVFSSSVAKLPLVGTLFNGYMPNREIITFDFAKEQQMSLIVEILQFLPTIDIYGDDLKWDETTLTIEYTIRRNDDKKDQANSSKSSTWKILYADQDIVAAKSSVTGLNVIRRIQ